MDSMSGVKGMARDSSVYCDALDKERLNGNERMISHRGSLYSETAVNALYIAVKHLKRHITPLSKNQKTEINRWLKKRRAKK